MVARPSAPSHEEEMECIKENPDAIIKKLHEIIQEKDAIICALRNQRNQHGLWISALVSLFFKVPLMYALV